MTAAPPPTGTPGEGHEGLRARLTGELVLPGDPGWDAARRAWHLVVDQRPEFVVSAETVADVVAVVTYAAAEGLRVVPQTTGHGAPAMQAISGCILLKTERMNGVEVDPVSRHARVEAGARWGDVVPLAAAHGLAALHGSSPDVGVVGYTLGGGVGWLARQYGLACNSVLAADVVTSDGSTLRVDADHHPDLFWALRGGGGSFGIVTALEFQLYPVRKVYAGVLFFPLERAAEVLHAWRQWTLTLPDSVTSIGRLLRFPPIPDLPEVLRGHSFVVVEACILGDELTASALLEPLRDLGAEIDTFALVPATELADLHMDPPQPVEALVHHRLLHAITDEAIDALVSAAGPHSDSPLLSVEVRHLGGALHHASDDDGVLGRVDADYLLIGIGLLGGAGAAAHVGEQLDLVVDALDPWGSDRDFLNLAERVSSPERLFGDHARRLADVAATYDPGGLMVANHPVRRQ
jgi:hypothetical protein